MGYVSQHPTFNSPSNILSSHAKFFSYFRKSHRSRRHSSRSTLGMDGSKVGKVDISLHFPIKEQHSSELFACIYMNSCPACPEKKM